MFHAIWFNAIDFPSSGGAHHSLSSALYNTYESWIKRVVVFKDGEVVYNELRWKEDENEA